jgi:hypothetical protein
MTSQMNENDYTCTRVEEVVSMLRSLTHKGDCVDGETMQYIIERVGLGEQLTRQLMMSADRGYVEMLWEEIVELERMND